MNSTALLRLCRAGCLSVALTSALLATPAFADGGRGANFFLPEAPFGGTDSITGTGGNGAAADLIGDVDSGAGGNSAGGGGAGATGGQGGTNTQGGTAAGGGSPGAAGADAFASGGGGGGAHGWVDSILPGIVTTGGNGGKGGDASDLIYPSFAAGGGGGAGGYGVVFTGLAGTLSASANVTGGNGGDGGEAALAGGGLEFGGSGGSGGVGLYVVDAATLTLNAQIKGGQGGAGGTALQEPLGSAIGGAGGTGGAGIWAQSGATLTINAAVMGGAGGTGGAASAPGNSQNAFAGNAGDGGAGVLAQSATVTINAAVTAGGGGVGGAAMSHQVEATGGTGGAGGAGVSAQSSTVTINAAVTGGDGGAGGAAATDLGHAGGGSGGVGGAGVSAQSGMVTINNVVTGGHGGAGGAASGGANVGGNGGNGGAGVQAQSGTIVTVNGQVIGGNGAAAGSAGFPGTNGAGGIGVTGSDITVVSNGSISGGLASDGTTRANAVTFTGGSNVYEMQAGASLTGNVVDTTGNGTFRLGGTVNSSFDLTALGTSQYQGFSHLAKSGSSTWTLTNSSGWTSDVAISGGTLFVQDSLANASLITVSGTGTLAGTGPASTVQVNAGGTFAPGNGTSGNGTLGSSMMVGSLAMQSGAFYKVFLDPTTSSFANVIGNAALNGATVNANFASGSYVVKQYTILNAGSITGAFSSTVLNTNLPSGFKTSLSYDVAKTKAYLDLALDLTPPPSGGGSGSGPTPPATGGLNPNQSGAGNAIINYFNTHTGIPMAFGALTPQGLTQVSGEIGGSSQQTSSQSSTQFMNIMSDPTAVGRGGAGGGAGGVSSYADQAIGYAAKPKSNNPRDAFASFTKAPPQSFNARWSTWAMGYGGSQTTDGSAAAGTNTSSSNIYGVAVGADYSFSPDTVAGFALSGGGTNFSVVNGGTGRSDMFQLGAFVRHNIDATYITASAAYGWQDVKTDRYVTVAGVDRLQAEFNTNSYSGRLEVGHRFLTSWIDGFGGLGMSPYAAVQVTAFELPAYAERAVTGNNTFALAYGANTSTATRSELGVRTDKSFALDGAMLTLRGRAAWAHDFNPNSAVSATFQTLPGASFVVNGAALAHDAALTTATAEFAWMNGWSVAGTFEGEFSDVTRSYAGKGVVRYNW